jgi:HlyD family secretion protein
VVIADTSIWQVETTDLTEINVVKFEPGASVKVNFDAISDLEINGKIERIKLIGQNKQGDITYTVVISLEKQDPRLRWNMTATATFEK